MSATILHIGIAPGDSIQTMALGGIRRYAAARGWLVKSVPGNDLGRKGLAALLAAHNPVAGCVIDCSDDGTRLPRRLFGKIPAVYLHPPPALRDGRSAYVATDNEAVARAAFRELSAGRPAAYAALGVSADYSWSRIRLDVFSALCAETGMDCRVLAGPVRGGWRDSGLLASWVAALPRHCAVFAVNDFAADCVVRAARAVHLSFPRDLTLLGVDNNAAVCEASDPQISSIQIDFERAGFLAARMIGDAFPPTGAKGLANPAPFEAKSAAVGPLLSVRRKSTGGRGRHEKFVLDALEIIRREACSGLTARMLASRFDCSRWLFEMRFREATGYSALDEILHVRLEKAITLLSQTDTAIGAIYAHCGFRSGRALDSIFHARFKTSMREWRRLNGIVR